jgi:glucosyl-dolichyl phosphate glucuronosyltransferase
MISDISVVICAYTEKRWNELIAAVASVQCQTLPPKDIVVVIDHNLGLLRRVQENLSGVIAIENAGDKGLSGARNSGWSTAQGEIVAFLDDDAIAEPDWLENLSACYAAAEVVGAGGKIVPLWETSRLFWFPEEFNWVIGSTYRGMPSKNARIRNVIGANMSIRRNILTAVGGFRESFGFVKDTNTLRGTMKWFNHYTGDEETEFCIRVSQQLPGSVWLYAASAVVQHRVSAERTRWAYFLWRCYIEGLGKASLVKLHDASTGLSSERIYTFKALPRGVARGLADTFLRFDLTGMLRAGAIVVGLTITTVGYLIGSIYSSIADFRSADLTYVRHPHTAEVPPPVNVQ